MALTKMQYDTIEREYQERQLLSQRLRQERRAQVRSRVPGFAQVEDAIASLAVSQGKLYLSGERSALEALKEQLADLSSQKRRLLTQAGFPADYLEPVYQCADCRDTGYIGREKCHCLRQREIALLYQQSHIQDMIERENFRTLSYEYYQGEDLTRFEKAVCVSKNFVRDFGENYQNLFFYGTVGTGKSFLSGCIAAELLSRGYSVIYFSSNGLFETLARYSFDNKSKEPLYNLYKDIYNCDLVIIDDLGTEVTNAFVTSQLFSLLNERHLGRRPTVISTNLSLEELRDRYSDRIFSRITSSYSVCKLTGRDIRIQKKLGDPARAVI